MSTVELLGARTPPPEEPGMELDTKDKALLLGAAGLAVIVTLIKVGALKKKRKRK